MYTFYIIIGILFCSNVGAYDESVSHQGVTVILPEPMRNKSFDSSFSSTAKGKWGKKAETTKEVTQDGEEQLKTKTMGATKTTRAKGVWGKGRSKNQELKKKPELPESEPKEVKGAYPWQSENSQFPTPMKASISKPKTLAKKHIEWRDPLRSRITLYRKLCSNESESQSEIDCEFEKRRLSLILDSLELHAIPNESRTRSVSESSASEPCENPVNANPQLNNLSQDLQKVTEQFDQCPKRITVERLSSLKELMSSDSFQQSEKNSENSKNEGISTKYSATASQVDLLPEIQCIDAKNAEFIPYSTECLPAVGEWDGYVKVQENNSIKWVKKTFLVRVPHLRRALINVLPMPPHLFHPGNF
jgi:hypothetical protein